MKEKVRFNKYIFVIFIIVFCFCSNENQKKRNEDMTANSLFLIDTNKKYPTKSINWAEIAETIEFIPLETTNEFLCGNSWLTGFTDEYIIYANQGHTVECSILIFDRQGKALRKIQKQGNGPEDYVGITKSFYDAITEEIFIYDMIQGKIIVYDLYGNFLRSFRAIGDDYFKTRYNEIMIYNDKYLICYTDDIKVPEPFFLISRQTGEKILDIKIPIKNRISTNISIKGGGVVSIGGVYSLVKSNEGFLLKEPSSDTVYYVSPINNIPKPFMVQNPSVQDVITPILLLFNYQAGPYLLLEYVKKEFDASKDDGFPSTKLVFDYKDEIIYENHSRQLYNNIGLNSAAPLFSHNIKNNVFLGDKLAFRAKQLENKEGIDPKLNEVISRMSDEDNPLVIIITLKK